MKEVKAKIVYELICPHCNQSCIFDVKTDIYVCDNCGIEIKVIMPVYIEKKDNKYNCRKKEIPQRCIDVCSKGYCFYHREKEWCVGCEYCFENDMI